MSLYYLITIILFISDTRNIVFIYFTIIIISDFFEFNEFTGTVFYYIFYYYFEAVYELSKS